MRFTFTRNRSDSIDWTPELARLNAAATEAARAGDTLTVSLTDKVSAEREILRRVNEFAFKRTEVLAPGYVAAWDHFLSLARIAGSEEAALLNAAAKAGVMTAINHPAARDRA